MIAKTDFSQFKYFLIFFILLLTQNILPASVPEIQTPEKYFGFQPGTDKMLFDYQTLIDYLQKLDDLSPRLKMVEIGTSPLGKSMYIAFISSEPNIQNLDRLKTINKKLALDPEIPDLERKDLIEKGRIFFLATLSMHSREVGPSQACPLIAHDLIITKDPEKLNWLNNVVFMMVPCHNPDGMDMIVNHYKKYKDTQYEGSSMPGIYHKYVGHDNNRDFITLTQSDNKAIARIYNLEWFPQVMIEKHQMGSGSVRYFVPPMHDPIAENVNASVWNWTTVFGSNLMADMTRAGLAGVAQHYLFDLYWPGSTETCLWKNVIGMLTEAASVKGATPVYVEPNELKGYGKGLSEYKKSINMPLPWPGGWWTLGNIVQYEIFSTMSLLKTASLHCKAILKFRNDICRKEVQKGQKQSPFYYVLPLKQHDLSELIHFIDLMKEHGIQIYQLTEDLILDNQQFIQNDIVIPLAQPFRPFIKEVMETQHFPVRHYTPGGEIIRPYDITSWSLPLHRGLTSYEIKNRSSELEKSLQRIIKNIYPKNKMSKNFRPMVFSANYNESYKSAFMAKQLGINVERLSENLVLSGGDMPSGSFIVYPSSKNSNTIDLFLEKLLLSPVVLKNQIKPNSVAFRIPNIALVETYFHDMDAGWTRYLFDAYHIPYQVIRPGDFKDMDSIKNFDIIVFPDSDKDVLMSGKYKKDDKYQITNYPPEFTMGIEKEGMENLAAFIDGGGYIIAWGRSTLLFMDTMVIKKKNKYKEEFQLPIQNISEKLKKSGLYCPGSLLHIQLKKNHPLTFGMPTCIGVFTRGRPVFVTSLPNFDMDRRVIATFPEKNILLSGYCEHEEKLGNKSAMVWLKKGKGQLVLFGFNPQFRASTQGSFKLIFNALLLPKIQMKMSFAK